MFSLNKHLKLHALQSHTSSLLKSLETKSLAVRTNILTEGFLSFLLPLKFYLPPNGLWDFISTRLPPVLIGVWKYEKKILAWKAIFNFYRFPKWPSLRSVGRLGVISHLIWTVLSLLMSHLCSVIPMWHGGLSHLCILRSSLWKGSCLYLLICSFLCLISIYWAVAMHQGESRVIFTNINKKWLLSLRSSKEKEK